MNDFLDLLGWNEWDDERTTIVEVMAFCDCPFCTVEHESEGGLAERDDETSPES